MNQLMVAKYGLCTACYEIYRPAEINLRDDRHTCPKVNCGHNLILVDEYMLPAIIMLNQKGYKTRQSSSSHIWDQDMYIKFRKYKSLKELTAPEGFKFEDDIDIFHHRHGVIGYTLRAEQVDEDQWNQMDIGVRQEIIFTKLMHLMVWIMSLPEKKEEISK